MHLRAHSDRDRDFVFPGRHVLSTLATGPFDRFGSYEIPLPASGVLNPWVFEKEACRIRTTVSYYCISLTLYSYEVTGVSNVRSVHHLCLKLYGVRSR